LKTKEAEVGNESNESKRRTEELKEGVDCFAIQKIKSAGFNALFLEHQTINSEMKMVQFFANLLFTQR
jgi:hypothetical protein